MGNSEQKQTEPSQNNSTQEANIKTEKKEEPKETLMKINNERQDLFRIKENSGVLFESKQNPNDMQETISIKLIKKTQVSRNSFIFSFELPNNTIPLGIQIGQHIAIDADIFSKEFPEGETVTRKYTPISWIGQVGVVDILLKVYYQSEKFPEGGRMSLYIDSLNIGDSIQIRGPFGKFQYFGDGVCQFLTKYNPVTYEKRKYSKIGMLGAGTGIAPLYQILYAADRNEEKDVEFILFYGNSTEKDILLKDELVCFLERKRFPFKLVLMINNQDEGWNGEVGHFNKENISKYMPEASDSHLILYCGTKSLCLDIYSKVLKQLGHKKENMYEF